jgi:hypothetical protein
VNVKHSTIPGEDSLEASVRIRVQPTIRRKWTKAAEHANRTVADWVRLNLDRAADERIRGRVDVTEDWNADR